MKNFILGVLLTLVIFMGGLIVLAFGTTETRTVTVGNHVVLQEETPSLGEILYDDVTTYWN